MGTIFRTWLECARYLSRGVCGAIVLALASHAAYAQAQAPGARTFPTKPVRLIVGYAPGGLPDTVARVVAQKLGDRWGQQVVVENRPSANAIVAAEYVARAAPDGYTLLVTDSSTTAINPSLFSKLPYDAERDFVPVSLTARAPLFLAAHPSVPVNTLQDFIALAKAKPGEVTYGSSGIGSTHHLTMASLASATGIKVVHVPFKGTGQSVPALIGGQVAVVFSALPSLSSYVKGGQLKLLAVNSSKRSAQAPDVPTIEETLSLPGFDFAPTIGFLAPAKTPDAIVAQISRDIAEAVLQPEAAKMLANVGVDAAGGSAADYAALLKADAERYARAIKESGIKVE